MASPYNMAFACLDCHKSFKREFNLAEEYPVTLICPHCCGTAHNLGRHFKAPKRTDKKQWAKVGFLMEHGFFFQKSVMKQTQVSWFHIQKLWGKQKSL